jgi:CRISPR-associated exonuclease Cas4
VTTKLYSEDELLPLSGLSQISFCDRRWALIHLESVWQENRFTAEGEQLHERAHSAEPESRPGVLVRRTLPLHSFRLGLSGQADIVEFHPSSSETAVRLPGRSGKWQAYPIEYKRSRDKAGSIAYRIQLCAQAICLEEMLQTAIPEGAIFDASTRRRQQVRFEPSVRNEVARLAERMHSLFQTGVTPPAMLKKACRNCSLNTYCMPATLAPGPSVAKYLERMVRSAE